MENVKKVAAHITRNKTFYSGVAVGFVVTSFVMKRMPSKQLVQPMAAPMMMRMY